MRFRSRQNKVVINSTKHILPHSAFSVASAAVTTLTEAVAVQAVTADLSNEVRAGSVIKAVFVELWIYSNSSSTHGTFYISIEKASGGQPDVTFAQTATPFSYPNKKNILYQTQGFVGQSSNQPIPILKQWVAIPKGKQRFGLGDEFRVNIASTVTGVQGCGITVYKEYY